MYLCFGFCRIAVLELGALAASPKSHLYLKLLDKSAILVLSLNWAVESAKHISGKINPTTGIALFFIIWLCLATQPFSVIAAKETV